MLLSKPKNQRKGLLVPAVILLLIVASVGGFYAYQRFNPPPSCANPLGGAKVLKTHLQSPAVIGGLSELSLPAPIRDPNAPTVAPDGSVWFSELSVPGFAHLYPNNGTLVEYAWPVAYNSAPSPGGLCAQKTSSWSVVLWDGKVWAPDTAGNQLVAMDPGTGQITTTRIPTASAFPYTLTPGPGNTLWFTELFTGKIGELSPNGTIREFALPGGQFAEPAQIVFANSTTGYVCDVGASEPQNGSLYSFNVDSFSPKLVGGQHLFDPTSISLGAGALWVALHGSSSVASYNLTTGSWSYYPTTPVGWNPTTLPYFVQANGSSIWFNEHYGNRMGRIDLANGSLTEYSESSRPVNGDTIGNAVTFALGGGRAWFAESTGNILGYADASFNPGFYTTISGNDTVVVDRGSEATVELQVHDATGVGLSLSFGDSESFSSTPANINFTAPRLPHSLPTAPTAVAVVVRADQSLEPGTYWAILTVTDGVTYESSFLKIVVPS